MRVMLHNATRVQTGMVCACIGGRCALSIARAYMLLLPQLAVRVQFRLCFATKFVRHCFCHPMQESLVLGQRGDELDGAEMPVSMPV